MKLRHLQATAWVTVTLLSTVPASVAQQVGAGSNRPDKAASQLPSAPVPVMTEPVSLRPSSRDFSKPFGSWLRNPLGVYRPTTIGKASFINSVRLDRSGEGRQDLPEPVRRDCAGDGEQLRHRHRALRPGHCGHGYSAHEDRGMRRWARLGPGDGNAGRLDFDAIDRRRAGRNDGGIGRRGLGRQRTDADHGGRRPGAGVVSIRRSPATIQFERQRLRSKHTFSGANVAEHQHRRNTTSPSTRALSPARTSPSRSNNQRVTTDNPFDQL